MAVTLVTTDLGARNIAKGREVDAPVVEVTDTDPVDGPLYVARCSGGMCPRAGFGPDDRFDTFEDAVAAAEIHVDAHAAGWS
jgi:hypothetical protein